jgi:hypothetical protein
MADHERVNFADFVRSCGVMQLSRLDSETVPVLFSIATRLYHPSRGNPCAFFMFSDTNNEDGAPSRSLVKLIGELGIGTVMQTDPVENPRTGNEVIVYVWAVDHEPFKKWYAEQRIKKMRTVGT